MRRRFPILRRSVTLGMVWNLTCLGPLEVLLPLLAREAGGDALAYGLLKGASPAGFILGILLAGALLPAGLASRRLLFLYALALLLQGLILGVMGRTTTPLLLLVLAFLGGLATGPTDVYVKLIRQREVPVGLQGRYLGLATALAYLASALGLALLGAVLGRVGPREAAALAGGALAVAALWAIFSGAAEADGRPPDPGRRTARKRFLGG
ncbi:MAG TPA: MFS transporter [Thermaerobacter sp.]